MSDIDLKALRDAAVSAAEWQAAGCPVGDEHDTYPDEILAMYTSPQELIAIVERLESSERRADGAERERDALLVEVAPYRELKATYTKLVERYLLQGDSDLVPTGLMAPPVGVTFTVPGVPIGKGRPRVSAAAGRARMYTPAKTVGYEGLIAHEARIAMNGRDLIAGPVDVSLDIAVPIPASWSQKKQVAALSGHLRPTGKPDIDNTCKAIFDGINQVVWKDDAQVVHVRASKRYALVPGVRVFIIETELDEA